MCIVLTYRNQESGIRNHGATNMTPMMITIPVMNIWIKVTGPVSYSFIHFSFPVKAGQPTYVVPIFSLTWTSYHVLRS